MDNKMGVIEFLIILFMVFCTVWSIVYLVYGVRCLFLKDCIREKCHIRYCCHKWRGAYTEEDWGVYRKLLEEIEESGSAGEITNGNLMEQKNTFRKVIDDILYIAVCLAALSFIGTAIWIIVRGIITKLG